MSTTPELELRPDRISMYSFAFVPWAKPHQNRIDASTLPASEVKLALYLTALERLAAAGYESIGIDHFALPGDEPLTVDAIATVDAVLVPALAVAADGTRLGRGGGSYDRALSRVQSGVPVAALIYDAEVMVHLPADAWDVPVTAYVSPGSGWHAV